MTDAQPIETAVQDRSWRLLWVWDREWIIGRWNSDFDAWERDGEGGLYEPTHWAPLPSLPVD